MCKGPDHDVFACRSGRYEVVAGTLNRQSVYNVGVHALLERQMLLNVTVASISAIVGKFDFGPVFAAIKRRCTFQPQRVCSEAAVKAIGKPSVRNPRKTLNVFLGVFNKRALSSTRIELRRQYAAAHIRYLHHNGT